MLIRVTLVIDTPALRGKVRACLKSPDTVVRSVPPQSRLWERLSPDPGDVIVLSAALIPEPTGPTIAALRQLPESPSVVVVADREGPEKRAEWLAAGCDAVLYAGLSGERMADVFETILAKRSEAGIRGMAEPEALAEPRLSDFVSSSPAMQVFMGVVQRVVQQDVTLLILGETGAGKEWLARGIHAEGPRANGPFVAVNLAAVPESLAESELFGHEEGAFTGATRTRRGAFELAHGGTLFLDEVGEVPYHLQVKMLRVLENHKIQRVGGEDELSVDVRVMAATNSDLEADVEAKRFRRDLYYRLSVVALTVPPLRERVEDIPALVESHIDYLGPRVGGRVCAISPEAMSALTQYTWPGNVRELMNVIERAMLLCDDTEITLDHLPESIARTGAWPSAIASGASREGEHLHVPHEWLTKSWRDVRQAALAQIEHAYLVGLLCETGGRIGETAKRAGIQPRSLYDKMRMYGIRKEDFRAKTGKG